MLGMLPAEMSPSLNISGAVHRGMILPKNTGTEQPWIVREYGTPNQAAKSALFLTQQIFFSLKWLFFFGLKVEEETAEAAETDAEGMII